LLGTCWPLVENQAAAKDLLEKAKNFDLNEESFDDVNVAVKAAKLNAAADDIIMVCGSIFLVAEVDGNYFRLPDNSITNLHKTKYCTPFILL
jgi:folylpolyglutamate synthase/dihydropteroate synthase